MNTAPTRWNHEVYLFRGLSHISCPQNCAIAFQALACACSPAFHCCKISCGLHLEDCYTTGILISEGTLHATASERCRHRNLLSTVILVIRTLALWGVHEYVKILYFGVLIEIGVSGFTKCAQFLADDIYSLVQTKQLFAIYAVYHIVYWLQCESVCVLSSSCLLELSGSRPFGRHSLHNGMRTRHTGRGYVAGVLLFSDWRNGCANCSGQRTSPPSLTHHSRDITHHPQACHR